MSRTSDPDRDLPDPAARETEADDVDTLPTKLLVLTDDGGTSIYVDGGDEPTEECFVDLSIAEINSVEVARLAEIVRRYNAYDTLVARLKADRHTFAEYWRASIHNGSHEGAIRNQAHVDAIDAALMKASKA